MKTTILTALLISFLAITGIYAQNEDRKVLTSIDSTKTGYVKELVFLNEETSEAETKTVYSYNKSNLLLEKIEYKWNSKKGWTPIQKYEYVYTADSQASSVLLIKWDSKKKEWDEAHCQTMAYIYADDGELIAVK